MEPFISSNTPPLSIAQVNSTAYGDLSQAPPASHGAVADQSALQEALLAAVITRVGEVEAAEWALDQAKAACEVQIAAALAAGVQPEIVAAAAGEQAAALTDVVDAPEPAPAES